MLHAVRLVYQYRMNLQKQLMTDMRLPWIELLY
ncbi:MAG: hypothetical protein ETSY2_42540 [Candidatus Entotheonella gemina]|uniref:Uncharacterized protein n=1 Tax=Candidatus Entotheonella gemina TaxID=1429439 RepID=W4LKU7_9BACT|nr:MAG: hypothetical protein ETSY2_42540 [Candidatus Entotheonella gemina]